MYSLLLSCWRSDNISHAWFYFLQSGKKYDAKADLWSVGTVLFEMISGETPFHGNGSLSDLLRNMQSEAARLPADVHVSKECLTLLKLTLVCNPNSRTDFKGFFEASEAFVALGCNGTPPPEGSTAPLNEIPSTSGQQIVDRNVCERMNVRAISENDGTEVPIEGKILSAHFGRTNYAADVQVAVEFSGNNGHHFKRILKIIDASTGKTIKNITLLSTWKNIAYRTLADGIIIYQIGNKISVYSIAFKTTEYNTTEKSDFQNTRLIEFLDDTTVVIVTKKNVYHWNILLKGSSRPVLVVSNHGVVRGSNICYTSSPDKRSALISTSKMFRLIGFPNTVGGAIRVGRVISIDGTILSTSYFKCRNNTCIAVCFVEKGVVLMRGCNEEGNIVLETIELAVDQPSTSVTARHSMHYFGESLVLLLTNRHESNTRIYTFNFSLDMALREIQITQSRRQIELSGQLIASHASEGGVFVVTNEGVLSLSFSDLNSDASSTDDGISSVNTFEDKEEFDSVDNDSNVDNDKQDNDPSVSDDNSGDDDSSNLGDKVNQIHQDVEDENGDKQNSDLCSESEDEKKPDPPVTPLISQAVDPPAGLASPLRRSPQDASTPSPASSSRSTAKNQAFSPASSEEDDDAKLLVSTSSVASSSGKNSNNASSTATFSERNDSDNDPTASVTNNQAFSPVSSLDLIASTSSVAGTTSNKTSSSFSSYERSDDDDDDDSAASGVSSISSSSSSSSGSNSNTSRTRARGGLRNIQRKNYQEEDLRSKRRQEAASVEEDDENREEQDETESDSPLQAQDREDESVHDDESENEYNHVGIGEVGYKFFKWFDACRVEGTWVDAAWYQGTVVEVATVTVRNGEKKKNYHCCACKYDDGDKEDLTLQQLEKLKAVEEAALAAGDAELLRKMAELQDDDA